jgi:septum formation protein
MTPIPLVLASASPRRRQLLERIGLRPEVVPAKLDETPLAGERAVNHVGRLARAKALAVAELRPGALVIAGDTVVVLDGEILAKPADAAEAMGMLLRLQGREHRVETGVAVVGPDGRIASDVVGADVRFRPFGRATAEAYVSTGEPMDKAGSYGIQGYGSVLVDGLAGDYFAVMGLPVAAVIRLVEGLGFRYVFGAGIQTPDDGGS